MRNFYHHYRIDTIFVLICSGTVAYGEVCFLRSQGETRPLHLGQIIHYASDSVGKMSKATLLEMLELIYGTNILTFPEQASFKIY